MKWALIPRITGQDGSWLAELRLQNGYEVHGIKRRANSFNRGRAEQWFGCRARTLLVDGLTATIQRYIETALPQPGSTASLSSRP